MPRIRTTVDTARALASPNTSTPAIQNPYTATALPTKIVARPSFHVSLIVPAPFFTSSQWLLGGHPSSSPSRATEVRGARPADWVKGHVGRKPAPDYGGAAPQTRVAAIESHGEAPFTVRSSRAPSPST